MAFDANKKVHKSSEISFSAAPAKKPRTIDRTDIAHRLCGDPVLFHLSSMADFLGIQLHEPLDGLFFWEKWRQRRGGWRNERTNAFLSVERVESMIDARIAELGLDRALIEAHRTKTSDEYISPAEFTARHRAECALSFEESMARFKKGNS